MERDERTDNIEEFEPIDTEEGEDMDLEDVEEQGTEKIKKLKKDLKACEAEKMKHLEELQRAKADFLNTRKRLEEQLARDRERITMNNMLAVLSLADSFDMAMRDPAWKTADERWRKGIESIYAQLNDILRKNDITAEDPTGEMFDPHRHEAVIQEAVSDDSKVDKVVRVLQTGYKKGAQVMRPAKVVVGIKQQA